MTKYRRLGDLSNRNSQSSGDLEFQDQSVRGFGFLWSPSPWLADGHFLTATRGLSSVHMHPWCLCASKFPLSEEY